MHCKLTPLLNQTCHVASRAVLEDEVKVSVVFRRAEQLYYKRVVHLVEEFFLSENMALLAKTNDLFLIDLLDRDHATSCLFSRQHHSTVGTLAQDDTQTVLVEIRRPRSALRRLRA